MSPVAPSPLLKLFGAESPGPGGSLQHVRNKIYSHAWSRVRRDDAKCDFVVSEHGVNRNVPERLIDGEDPFGHLRAPRFPPPACNLHLVSKQISKDFARYIYSMNDLEIDVDLKTLQTAEAEAALQKIAALLRNPNFQKYTRSARIRIHFPAKYPVANLPSFNQKALENIRFALDDFQNLGHMVIRMVPGQGALLDYELRLAAFPFYPMRLTSWSIRTLNTNTSTCLWDLVLHQSILFLNKAYQIYLQTGSLTAPVLPSVANKPALTNAIHNTKPAISDSPSGGNKPALSNAMHNKQPTGEKSFTSIASQNLSVPASASKKKRQRKKKPIAKFAAAAHKAAANTETVTPVKASHNDGIAESVTGTGEADTEIQTPGSEAIVTDIQSSDAKATAKEQQPLDQDDPLVQVRPSLTVLPSPPLSSGKEREVPILRSSSPIIDPIVPAPANSAHKDVEVRQYFEPSSPAASSVTLGSVNESLATENVDETTGGDQCRDGSITQKPRPKRKQRNKKSKNNKSESRTAKATESHRDAKSADSLDIESDVEEVETNSPEGSNAPTHIVVQTAVNTDGSTPQFTSYTYDELNRGAWVELGAEHVLFNHPDTDRKTLVAKTARINRYIHQQERRKAIQPELAPKSAKITSVSIMSVRKARQVAMRRGHPVAVDSPLDRASRPARPRDAVQQPIDSKSSPSSADVNLHNSLTEGLIVALLEQQHINNTQLQVRRLEESRRAQQLQIDHNVGELEDVGPGSDEEENPDSDGDTTASNTQDSTACPMFVFQVVEDEESQGAGVGEVPVLDTEENASLTEQLHQDAQVETGECNSVDGGIASPERYPSSLSPEHGVSQTSVKPDDKSYKIPVPHELVLLSMPANVNTAENTNYLSQGSPEMYAPGTSEVMRDLFSQGAAQQTNDAGQKPPQGIQPARRGPKSRPGHGGGRGGRRDDGRGGPNGRGNYMSQRKYSPSLGKSNSHQAPDGVPTVGGPQPTGNGLLTDTRYASGRGCHGVSTGVRPPQQSSSRWLAAVQADDQKRQTENMERQLALEQEMEAKGTTYADYSSRVEDSYIKRDEDGMIVPEKTDKILYDPRLQAAAL